VIVVFYSYKLNITYSASTTYDRPTGGFFTAHFDAFVQSLFKAYPLATEQLLAADNMMYFLAIVQQPGQKPALFIPVLDVSFKVWFKKVVFFQIICHAIYSFLLIIGFSLGH
jgi:hypothetical protein